VHLCAAHLAAVLVHLLEALVERQVVAHRVLPAGRRSGEVREVLQDPAVDLLHRQPLVGRVLDGHEDQAAEGVRRLPVGARRRVVRRARRVAERRGVVRAGRRRRGQARPAR